MVTLETNNSNYLRANEKTHKELLKAKNNNCNGDYRQYRPLHLNLRSIINKHFYLFGVLRCFQHCTGHITTGSWKGRGNQYFQFVGVLYCKLPTNGKQLPAVPLEAVPGTEPRPQRWEARVLPLSHHGPLLTNTGTS